MCHYHGVRAIALLVATLLAALAAASGAVARDTLVRPAVGMGKLRLGMSLKETRQALGQRIQLELTQTVRSGNARLVQYVTLDEGWRLRLLGPKGKEKLVGISTESPRERLRNGVGVGTAVATLPARLAALDPKCVAGQVFVNYRLIPVPIETCAISTRGALTIFSGSAECAVIPVRYQGCPNVVVSVASVTIESEALTRHGLSWWDPTPEPPPITP